MGKSLVSLVNSHTNAARIGWHLWKLTADLPLGCLQGGTWGGAPPPYLSESCQRGEGSCGFEPLPVKGVSTLSPWRRWIRRSAHHTWFEVWGLGFRVEG